jgi:hypothetical protein
MTVTVPALAETYMVERHGSCFKLNFGSSLFSDYACMKIKDFDNIQDLLPEPPSITRFSQFCCMTTYIKIIYVLSFTCFLLRLKPNHENCAPLDQLEMDFADSA